MAVPYPRRLLLDDEDVVLDLRPHWRRVALAVVALPLVAGATSYAWFDGPGSSAYRVGVLVVGGLLLAVLSLRPLLRRRAERYVVTTHRVILRSGVVRRTGRDVALHRLTDVALDHGLADRMFGSGDLVLESDGEHGQLVLVDVPHVDDVHRTLYELADEAELRRAGGGLRHDGHEDEGEDDDGGDDDDDDGDRGRRWWRRAMT